MKMNIAEMTALCNQIRRDIVRMVYEIQSGHPGGSLGCVEYFVALYGGIMRYNPQNFTMEGKEEDLFFLSNGHISPVYYSTLARMGFFPIQELSTFRKINSRLQGHPATDKGLPGIRVATGSLGQGLSVAIGAALAKKLDNDERYVYCLMGDGENQEGQIWEAALFAAHHKVDNLIAAIDLNFKQIDGDTRTVLDTHSLEAKWQAFNWQTLTIQNGNDLQSVLDGFLAAQKLSGKGKPVVMLLHTTMGFGVDYMVDDYRWHGKAPNKADYERAMAQLPITLGDY